MKYNLRFIAAVLLALFLIPCIVLAGSKAIKVGIDSGKAEITLLEGKAILEKKADKKKINLSKGDFLEKGDRITTGKKSRMELKLPDGSFLRFSELSTFELTEVSANYKEKRRNISVNIVLGKTWAKVSKLFRKKGRFAVSTKTAVAGVRGTDFSMDVNKDNSAVLKVYDGEVEVSKRKEEAPASAAPPGIYTNPVPIAGPRPITMEQWTFIVGKMQQININPDGSASPPFRFNLDKDLSEWVMWNRMRDKQVQEIKKNMRNKIKEGSTDSAPPPDVPPVPAQ